MTVNEKLQDILNTIGKFEDWIDQLQYELELKHYDIQLNSRVIPYCIEIRLPSDQSTIISFAVDYDDVILAGKFNKNLQDERDRVTLLGDMEALAELNKIQKKFGFEFYLLDEPKSIS